MSVTAIVYVLYVHVLAPGWFEMRVVYVLDKRAEAEGGWDLRCGEVAQAAGLYQHTSSVQEVGRHDAFACELVFMVSYVGKKKLSTLFHAAL